jgi:hypothetical protein
VAKSREPLEVEVFIYGSLKNLAVGPRFKIRTESRGESDNVRLGRTMSVWYSLWIGGSLG